MTSDTVLHTTVNGKVLDVQTFEPMLNATQSGGAVDSVPMRAEYDRQLALLVVQEESNLQLILCAKEECAKEVVSRLKNGEAFDQLTKYFHRMLRVSMVGNWVGFCTPC